MWFALIVSGALHGLVFLPVLLSLAGGQGYSLEDADEEWMSSAVRRHDHEYTYVSNYLKYSLDSSRITGRFLPMVTLMTAIKYYDRAYTPRQLL